MTATAGPEGTTLARLRWWDLEGVLALERDLFGPDAWSAGQFWSELARVPESRWYLLARQHQRVVGYAGVFLVGPEADIQTVAVAPGMQGRGVGRMLLCGLVDRARDRGAHVMHLEVRADNAAALRLYERAGFVADGRRRDYYGPGRDALLMSLALSGPPGPAGPVEPQGGGPHG